MKSFLVAFVLFPLLTVLVHAAAKVTAPPPESKNLITNVNSKTHEVTIIYKNGTYTTAKNPKTYTIDELTTVTINNVPGTFAEIRAGMEVMGTTERDGHTLDNITLEGSGTAPAEPPKPAPKPKTPPKPKS